MSDSLINLLKQLNFTENESKLYITLLKNGACTGYEASKLSGVPRSKVYGLIESLLSSGSIEMCNDDKTPLYKAIPIDRLQEKIRDSVDQLLNEIGKEASKVTQPREDERIWKIVDYDGILTKTVDMIRSASNQLYVQIWTDELDDRIVEAINDKIDEIEDAIIVLYDMSGQYQTNLKKFYRHGFEHGKIDDIGHRWITVAYDKQEMLHSFIQNEHVAEAIYTKNKSMVFFADEYIYHDAACLRIVQRLGDKIAEEFGGLENIRDVLDY